MGKENLLLYNVRNKGVLKINGTDITHATPPSDPEAHVFKEQKKDSLEFKMNEQVICFSFLLTSCITMFRGLFSLNSEASAHCY